MKTKGIAKRLLVLVMALALVVTNITVYQPQTVEAASKKTTGNKNRIEFVTTETMKGKEYTEENMRLNRVTAVWSYVKI